ncbi:hypothetical protein V1517DRAFT_319145 [Lipomyces orientalis]|uniref:Uncharacterized protein n=1 Tax=Lipomyces orientalis TaxID=1233043 RepID=A0ACC3TRR5_9ASCO
MDPNETGFTFHCGLGHSSQLPRKDNPGIHFLEYPKGILDVPLHQFQTARIMCMHVSLKEYFAVEKGGVEGTIVQMPECGLSTYARAVSLTLSQGQKVPVL